jgi:Tol biopolymer transport system component
MNARKKVGHVALAGSAIFAASCAALFGPRAQTPARGDKQAALRSTIAFVSTRHDPMLDSAVDAQRAFLGAEIYLMDGDGTNPRRLTENNDFDCFPALSPDGSRVVLESNGLRAAGEPFNTSDLFVMNVDGTAQRPLVRGASAAWSPDGRSIAFHASASGAGKPIISPRPGAATTDSDIFVLNVDDFLERRVPPRNITNTPAAVDDDPDWSPDGRKIAFTRHAVTDNKADNHPTAEIYVTDAGGAGSPVRLTNNAEEERAPAWSPDGTRILFMCRKGAPAEGRVIPAFQLCVMNADGTGLRQLTTTTGPYLGPDWSPDGRQIIFQRALGGAGRFQLFLITADGTGERQLTNPPGLNGFANWGNIRRAASPR